MIYILNICNIPVLICPQLAMAEISSSQMMWAYLDEFEFNPSTTQQLKHGFMARIYFNQCNRIVKDTLCKLIDITGLPFKKDPVRRTIDRIAKYVLQNASKIKARPKVWENVKKEMNR